MLFCALFLGFQMIHIILLNCFQLTDPEKISLCIKEAESRLEMGKNDAISDGARNAWSGCQFYGCHH